MGVRQERGTEQYKRVLKNTAFDFKTIKGRFSALLLLCVLIMGNGRENTIKAAETETISEQCQLVYFSDGSSLLVESTPREVVITGTHVKSEARISYETTGFTITLEQTGGMVESVPHSEAVLLLKEEIIGEEVTTTYRIDRSSIVEGVYALYRQRASGQSEEAIRQSFLQEIHQNSGIDFYLHNIFCVIRREGGSGSKVLDRSKSYRNLGTPVGVNPKTEGIWNAVMDLYGVEWAEPTKRKLSEYYDIHLKLYMAPCSCDIVLADEEGSILSYIVREAPSAQYAAFCRSIPEEYREDIVLESGVFRLTERSVRKSYVCYGEEQRKEQMYSMGTEDGLKIRLATGELEFNQLYAEKATVFLICERIGEPEGEEPSGQETQTDWRIDLFDAEPRMQIAAWAKSSPLFLAEQSGAGIPVNEYLYAEAETPVFLLEAEFVQKEGELLISVPVSRTYRLEWREKTGEEDGEEIYEQFADEITRRLYVAVRREYCYTELVSLECYLLSDVRIVSEVFEEGEVLCTAENGLIEIPGPELISWLHFEGEQEHLQLPPEFSEGIVLETLLLYGEEGMPELPEEDFEAEAEQRLGELLVRDDRFAFGGTSFLSDEFSEYEKESEAAAERLRALVQETQKIVTGKLLIPEYLPNGCYESSGEAVYRRLTSMTMQYPEELIFEPEEVNAVYVHTPVYCCGRIEEDNKKYCQLVSPSAEAALLIPDEEGISGDFIAAVSNTGFHSYRRGYGTRDYSETLIASERSYLAKNEEGVLRNEVKFPFDVYRDIGNNFQREDDVLCPANQWIAIGREQVRFYLPIWAPEGIFEVQFRAVAVNGEGRELMTQSRANTSRSAYVALDVLRVQISGKLYGFRITDITDYPLWQEVFKADAKTGNYTVGTRDEYGRETGRGSLYTLPLGRGSHPEWRDACYKPGYAIRFGITVSGTALQRKGAGVEIVPRFYYADQNGSREEVFLYTVRRPAGREVLVRVGDKTDAELWVNPPDSSYPAYSYGKIRIINEQEYSGEWIRELKFEYSLPRRLYAVSASREEEVGSAVQGIDFSEDFWKKNGYLIVNFNIVGLVDGKRYLSYDDAANENMGYCNMWLMEGQKYEKKDKGGILFQLCPGDVLIVPLGSSISSDYIAGGIY